MNSTSTVRQPGGPRQQRRHTPKANLSDLYQRAFKEAWVKLNPKIMVKNPVMFMVWVGTLITGMLTLNPNLFGVTGTSAMFNGLVTVILLFTVLFANFAEAVAEGRGKAQADALRSTQTQTYAQRILADGSLEMVSSTHLRKGDRIVVSVGDIIPADGEVLEGVASVDESAITGESAPVLKEPGSDVASSVTGGTRIISDELIIRVTADPGKGFIDRMIDLVEGAERSKTPNEIALTVLLAVLTLVFLIVVATLPPPANYIDSPVSITLLIALLVALIPTTIGGLLSAIGIAGMDRVAQFNVVATSGRAVEACGDINTLVLDKTGTITLGNRLAETFLPVNGHSLKEVAAIALAASIFDTTPEGKSIVRLAEKMGATLDFDRQQAEGVEFSARTRMSGTDLPDGSEVRKGAVDAIRGFVRSRGGKSPTGLDEAYGKVSHLGGTPLAVCRNDEIYGVIYLKDIIKPGIQERFNQLRRMGVRTVMLTGDNRITASVIAKEAGVDDFIAEATPEDKIQVIQQEQAAGKLVAMTGDGTNDAPALAQANVGLAMNSGTQAAKEAANMVDLDSDPTKLIDLVTIGKQLLITRGALTTFSLANDIAKYFAIIPAMFAGIGIGALNIMDLKSPQSAVLSALIYNALIIPALIPLALRGVKFRPLSADQLLQRNILVYGLGGIIVPFVAIKLIDLGISLL
ncbi:potassium-transporting ATPase B chain [Synechocystis sp. PCC 6803]|uniref:Potassium-transporting ATPase ATP-binding subunit n=1 Tax=Synechocystis sp. (strain ATCC 27184 / PCC 6803 / Kazusa) TaxID=1111708 RepID=KDPB_SYNY3|nr:MULTISPECIES: potassium-transporting ATPase subunit KdpB [unclassified Synechocystis]P73867.1 RecName: Full=Potassium-transporting ATPase ATP-binding subunit; AltName: Full=ATP phosphohydrolase [potassium-transporting] B chain; AltName: Full=Potassium-binding and translocating subunit B; AltName: Full=Potassium-translocating ATPase B chain [Synechocystis sp. PCC 6803 substr. Kazusa]AGF51617.1 potassium-transporting ATPase B chain [Synechocystis sp. PCC 6803]ALJ67609.1 potassium transporter Tr